ncbi:hypothetical protein [Streptomyces sp. PAM3C]|uniref:hypothetical protein n=1 Tax=Streptomyces sp. PAM3C TaxID=2847300 RepID=UPI001C1E5057|nr:hypothetical protein [Streptomyces sp. PAM3C]MBU5946751.1 hypothetical protein [Streptomyces sp. PAM3C]
MSRDLQHRLHSRLELAAQMLDLPLTAKHLEDLAVELTPAIKALLAEQADAQAAATPVDYSVVEEGGVRTTTYAQCTSRVDATLDPNCPAARLAREFRSRQPDVLATDVPSATYLGLTVRPQSLHAWTWWVHRLGLDPAALTRQDDKVYGVGSVGQVIVHVCGDGVPELMTDEAAARLMGLLAETESSS